MAMNLGTATATITLNNSAFLSGVNEAESAMTRLGGSGSKLSSLGKVAGGLGTLLAVPFAMGLKGAIDLEQSIANVNAALGGVDSGTLDQLSTSFQKIGADSQYSATEVANVGEELIKAGFGAEDLLGGMTQSVVELAQATGDGLGPAMDGTVQVMSTWKEGIVDSSIAMTDSSRVADILTVAANQSKAGLGDIQAGMRSLGPVAAMMGIPVEDAAAAIALFTNNGLKGADAGISLARGLQNLSDPTTESAALMNELGIAAFDMEGTFVGFPSLFRQLQTGMSGLDDQTKFTALSTMFGAEAMDVMGLAIMNGADPLEAMIAMMGESGAAAEQSAMRMDTLGAQFDTLKEGALTLAVSFVSGLMPGFRFVVDGANMVIDALMRIPGPIKTIVGALAGLTVAYAALTIGPQIIGGLAGLAGMTGVFAGFGGALLALIGPALAVAAVAGTIYLAWRTNFLGFRDLVTGAVDGVKGVFTGLKDTWDDVWADLDGPTDVMKRINDIGGVVGDTAKYSNRFARVLATIGGVMQRLSGNRFLGWLGPIGDAFENAGQFVEGFLDTWKRLGTDGDSVMGRVNRWGGVATNLGNGFDTAGRLLRSFSFGLKMINGDDTPAWLVDVALGMDRLAGKVEGAGTVFRALREQGLSPLEAGFHTLMVTVPGFRDAIGSLAPAWRPAMAAFNAFRDGNYAEGFRQVGQSILGMSTILASAAIAAGSWVLNVGAPAITGWLADTASDAWGALSSAAGWAWGVAQDVGFWALSVAAPAIGGWLADTASDVWSALSTAAGWAWGVAQDVGAWTLNVAIPALTGWLSETAGNVWDALKTAAGWVGDIAGDLGAWILKVGAPRIESAIDIAVSIANWVREKISGINWSGVSDALITGFSEALRGAFGAGQLIGALIGGGIDIGGRILDWVAGQIEGINWGRAGEAVGRGLAAAIGGIGWMMTLGPSYLAGFISALGGVNWGEAASAFWRFFTAAFKANVSFLGGLAEGIGGAFLDAVGRVEWGSVLDTVVQKFGELPGKIGRAIADKGPDVLRGFMESIATGARAAWDGVSSLVGDVFMNLPADLMRAVAGKGADILSSFMQSIATGARAAWDAVSSLVGDVFRNLPADLARAVTSVDPTTILSSFMTSIATGARAAWDGVSSLVGDVFRNLPADLARAVTSVDPSTILSSFMTSIATGARAAWDAVSSQIGDVFRNLPADLARAVMSIDPTTILSTFMTSIATGARAAWDSVSPLVGDVFRNLPADLQRAVMSIDPTTILSTFMTSIATGARAVWDSVSSLIGDVFRNLPADLARAVTSVDPTTILSSFMTSIALGARAAWDAVSSLVGDVFRNLPADLQRAVMSIDPTTILTSFMQSIASGARAAWDAVSAQVGDVFRNLPADLQRAVGNGASILVDFMQSVATGARSAWDGVSSNIGDIFRNLPADLTRGVGSGASVLVDFVTGIVTGAIDAWNGAIDPLKTIFSEVGDKLGSLIDLGAIETAFSGIATAINGVITVFDTLITKASEALGLIGGLTLGGIGEEADLTGATAPRYNPETGKMERPKEEGKGAGQAALPAQPGVDPTTYAGTVEEAANRIEAAFSRMTTALTTFNSGPMTTLNAGFPILGATMATFNDGILTTITTGFESYLGPTLQRFNAGPLTTLNAAFPILTATMTAFNAGPLTLLNAGFPILSATILAFNAGPLTTLNAAFPILTASIIAFNLMGLTVLNAGFPILAATILAFNAGPLTTLNAAFPILTASIIAFNLLGLTVLNAGFPILAATVLAFNAGPLTTLNAAFPILTASIVAFNTMGLTVLNAGFPLLGATILAFNAGPLTLLNAAFPILTASMVAFNASGLTVLNAGFPILSATVLAFNAGPLTTLNAAFPILVASIGTFNVALTTSGATVMTFGGTVTAAMASMTSAVTSGMAQSVSAVTSGMAQSQGAVQSGVAAMSGAMQSGMAQMVGSVTSGMTQASGAVRSGAAQWPGIIAGMAGPMGAAGRSAGAAASAGVAAGLRSRMGEITAAANEIVRQVDRALKAAAEAKSPSRLTARVGRDMTAGVAVGMLDKLGTVSSAARSLVSAATPDLTGEYTFGDKMFGRARGSLGGAIINGWERLTDGLYRDISGVVRKGILAEDNFYMVPRNFGGIGGRVDESAGLERILEMTRRNRERRDALDRALGTSTLVAQRRRGQHVSAATRAGSRPNTAGGTSHVTYVTHTEKTHAPNVYQVVPEELHRIMVDSRDGGSAAQTLRTSRSSAQARSGRQAPMRRA